MVSFNISSVDDITVSDMQIALISSILAGLQSRKLAITIKDIGISSSRKEQETLDILKKFAIEQDQLLYQSEYLGRYQQFALNLVERSKAFVCLCIQSNNCISNCRHDQKQLSDRIKNDNTPFCIRAKMPDSGISFYDATGKSFGYAKEDIGFFTILNSDNIPTQSFANACNDILLGTSVKINVGSNTLETAKEIHIRLLLDYITDTDYIYLPTIKSGDIAIKDLLQQGFLPDAIINYLLLLTLKTPMETFTLPEAVEWFDIHSILKESVEFDIEKLKSINRIHLKKMGDKELSAIFGFADEDIGKLLKLYLQEKSTISDLETRLRSLFEPKRCEDEEIRLISNIICNAPMLDNITDLKKHIRNEYGAIDNEKLEGHLRVLLAGSRNISDLDTIYPLIKSYITEIARCSKC